jgi:putative SOS response-associated peptidase YedK
MCGRYRRTTSEEELARRYHIPNDSPFVFAGLWEGWKEPAIDDKWLHTCTIITGEPNELVAQIHTRMPVILGPEHHEALVKQPSWERGFSPLPQRRNESVADQSARQQSEEQRSGSSLQRSVLKGVYPLEERLRADGCFHNMHYS